MNQKTFCLMAGLIFLVVAILHVVMFVLGESVIVFGQLVPVWSNLVIALIAGYFACQGLKLRK